MSDELAQFSKAIVRQKLSFWLRRNINYFNLFLYLIAQYFMCKSCAEWRRVLYTHHAAATLPSFSNSTSNSTESSFSNQNLSSNETSAKVSIPPLYAHTLLALFMITAVYIFITIFRIKDRGQFRNSVAYLNFITTSDIEKCQSSQDKYRRNIAASRGLRLEDENTLLRVLVLPEKSSLYRWFYTTCIYWNPRVRLFGLSRPSIDCTLTDYMLSSLRENDVHQIFGAIEIIHEVMKGIDYLHYRHVYHLNLSTDSVKIHCNGKKVYIKLSDFNFMKKAVDKKVISTSVGLRGFYRPLECTIDQDVDAEKCDMWGLGMMALDVFTGGMFRILSETEGWSVQNSDEYIQKFIQRRPFLSYVQASYGVLEMFQDARYNSYFSLVVGWSCENHRLWCSFRTKEGYKTYKVNHLNFLSEIRCFVYRLLIFNPKRRISLDRAFKEPLILNRQESAHNPMI